MSLAGVPRDHVLVDLDCADLTILRGRTRCDYVFFAAESGRLACIVPIELKSGSVRLGKAVQQLQAGADIASSWIPSGPAPTFVPVLVHGRRIHMRDRRALRSSSKMITFRDLRKNVQTIRCGAPLSKAISKA